MAEGPVGLESIYRIDSMLERHGVPHAFIGGVAMSAWGVPRATFDMDLALSMKRRLDDVLRDLEGDGLVVDRDFARGFRDRLGGMEMIHVHLPIGSTLLAIDLFLAETPFLQLVLARSRRIDFGRGLLPVCSPADLLLFKLHAGRPKDQVDIDNLVAIQGIPEREYLETWAERLGVADRLRRLFTEGDRR